MKFSPHRLQEINGTFMDAVGELTLIKSRALVRLFPFVRSYHIHHSYDAH